MYSNTYHLNPPSAVKKIGECRTIHLSNNFTNHRPHHLDTNQIPASEKYFNSRIPLFYNEDITLSKVHLEKSITPLLRNGSADELFFIHNGTGTFKSNFGDLDLKSGDYLVIPRGVTYQINVTMQLEALVLESFSAIETPERYRNKFGQLLEHSPFSERDIRTPKFSEPVKTGPAEVDVKLKNFIQKYQYENHPFDLVGWDGYFFPFAFSIHDFMPITGKIHQPPSVHQTFKGNGFVVCSFVPRLFDYHPNSIPAPYSHSNVDSDEIIYYSSGDFMSRKGIQEGSITHHPMGIPHGPQPGKTEESIGKTETNEFAIMIDTFKSLNMTNEAEKIEDKTYPFSWTNNDH
jgi:homogentisate 1,2-dioxygenase